MRSESYPEFRKPYKWVDGSSGCASISYKGLPDYSFKGDEEVVKILSRLQPGETYSYVEKTWDSGDLEIVIRKEKDQDYTFIINGHFHVFENFGKHLEKALYRRYYDDEIRIVMVPRSYDHPKNHRGAEKKIITLYLEEDFYVQVEAYYDAITLRIPFLEGEQERDFYFKFQNGWENLRKIKFNRRTTWQLCISHHEKSSNYVNPRKVFFEGRCQCEKCAKDSAFQNVEKVRNVERVKIHLFLRDLNARLEPKSNALIIMKVPYRYIKLVKQNLDERIHVCIGSNFSMTKDKATVWICEPRTCELMPTPKFIDRLPYYITIFVLDWNKEELQRQWQEHLESEKEQSEFSDYLKQYACVCDENGKWILNYQHAPRIT